MQEYVNVQNKFLNDNDNDNLIEKIELTLAAIDVSEKILKGVKRDGQDV